MNKRTFSALFIMVFILFSSFFFMSPIIMAQSYHLRLSTVVSAPHPWIDMAEFMAEEMSKRTNGEVEITIYPSGTLGNDEATIDEMRLGTIDLIIGGAPTASAFIKEYQIFALPYLINDMEHFERIIAYEGAVFNRFVDLWEEKNLGVILLSFAGGGTRNTSNNLRPIYTPNDLAGVKMRVPGSPLENRIWSTLGALPTSMPWTEIYSALQTGVVNAFESSISGYYGSKLYEVAEYHSKTNHDIMVSHILMGEISAKRLPEEYQEILAKIAVEAGILGTRLGVQYDEELLEELEKYNVKINEVDKESFIDKVAPIHDEEAARFDGSELLELIRELL